MADIQSGEINIRHVVQSDIDSILALDKKVNEKKSIITYRDMKSLNFGGPLCFSFVAEIGGKIVGFVLARLSYVYIPITEICIVNGILIDPEYQRRQIGSRLMNELISYCHTENVNTIRALVDERDTELRQFAENLGFHRSRIVNYDKTFET